ATIKNESQKAHPLVIKKSGEHDQNNHRILDWANIKIPWLMVSAQNDGLVEAPQNDQLAGLPENIHAILFEDCGHFIMLEESSKFQRLMTEFLSLPSGKSPSELKLKEEWKRRIR
ncbi:MAG: alpha/beta hydrolase, partial [Anaerolineaceae bacterium]